MGIHTSDTARVKTLTGTGPLKIDKDHVLAQMLPDAWEADAARGQVNITQNNRHEFVVMRLHGASDCMRAKRVHLADQPAVHCPGWPLADASLPDTWQPRLSLGSSRLCNHPPINHPARLSVTGMRLHGASDCNHARTSTSLMTSVFLF